MAANTAPATCPVNREPGALDMTILREVQFHLIRLQFALGRILGGLECPLFGPSGLDAGIDLCGAACKLRRAKMAAAGWG